ncbi:MAG: alpha-amylase family glycosyl hydrolase [Agathobacter rectalis]
MYLTPINESPSNHKYDTTDYAKIDRALEMKIPLKACARST